MQNSKKKTPFFLEIDIDEFDQLKVDNDLVFISSEPNGDEIIIDKGMERLVHYLYDEHDRCIENRIYTRTFSFNFEVEDEDSLMYSYVDTIHHSYLEGSSQPFRTKMEGFWVANKYDKKQRLIQSVTSKGSTLQQTYQDDALVEKRFKIKHDDDKVKEYVFTFEPDSHIRYVEYQDSDGNFWNEGLGFDCPFENPVQLKTKLNNNNLLM